MTSDPNDKELNSRLSMAMQKLPRLFILGAGFSVPAGLPTSDELLDDVLGELRIHAPNGSMLENSLNEFREYALALNGGVEGKVDIEQFSEYLSIDHYLKLRGSDTWSDSGNEDQLMLRWCLGAVLHKRSPTIDATPSVYFEFAKGLRARDVVVTFNYDRVLENVLDHLDIHYRLVPFYISDAYPGYEVIDSDRGSEEIIVLKVHGSIDWIDATPFEDSKRDLRASGVQDTSSFEGRNKILGPNSSLRFHDLVSDERAEDDRLKRIKQCEDVDGLYSSFTWSDGAPLLLIPAVSKLLYADPVLSFWQYIGRGEWGFIYNGITVIGYSLPPADRYSQQVIYQLALGYVRGRTDEHLISDWHLPPRPKFLIIDRRATESLQLDLKDKYRFIGADHATFIYTGFASDVLDVVFGDNSGISA